MATSSESLSIIQKLLWSEEIDFLTLKKLSRQVGGFLDNQTRARVWPKLLQVNRFNTPHYRGFIESHRDDSQVRCDIERSLWSHKHTEMWSEPLREKRRQALSDIIRAILCRNSEFHYYQGYHDVVSVFLLVAEEDHLAFALAEAASKKFLVDYLGKDFEILSHTMQLIMVLIVTTDPKLGHFLAQANVEPFFATSWLITWFAHNVKVINDVARIYDAMLCSDPLFALYLCAAMAINSREEIFECDCDFATLFNFLVHSTDTSGIPFEDLLVIADKLILSIPPEKLKNLGSKVLREFIDRGLIDCFKLANIMRVKSDWVLLRDRKRCRPITTNVKERYLCPLRGGVRSLQLPVLHKGVQVVHDIYSLFYTTAVIAGILSFSLYICYDGNVVFHCLPT
jgi:hypothetical protein